ncbi:MAG TPA: hypothetical protein VLU38_03345 [Methanomassiliicoccales archaeon]|nr:hypothetical protein [Methanomassiliicoccales archaeon]
MSQRDVRAVDNPITAVFDLADEVNREVPRIRKLVTYATVFIGAWLVISFILMLVLLFSNPVLGLVVLLLFVIGILALAMLRNLGDFMRYYSLRHAAIVRVRNDDPVIYVPKGETAVARLLEHIRARNPSMAGAIASRQYQAPSIQRGASSVFYSFDAYLSSKPGALWKVLGLGYPGYQLFIKCFQSPPRPEDLASLQRAAEDVSQATKLPPSRVIALWTRSSDQDLSEDAYQFLIGATVRFSHRTKNFASSLELIIENHDGTYEFIPYVAEGGYFSAPRAQ